MLCAKRGQCLLIIAVGLSAAGLRAWAMDASDILVYSIGPVHIKPRLTVAEQYDDNIFYRPGKVSPFFPSSLPVEDDLITFISPGVTVQLGRKEANHIIFDYGMDQLLYVSHRNEDHRDHSLSLDAPLQGNRVALEGQTGVQFLAGILGGSLAQGTNQIARVDRVTYSDSYRLEYSVGEKTSTYLVGSFAATDYKEGTPLYDENDLRGTVGFGYKVRPKVSLFGEGYYGQTAVSPNVNTFSNAPYSSVYGGYIGVSGDFTARLKGAVKVGYETRDFGGKLSGSRSPVVDVTLTDTLSERTRVSLSYSRRSEVSIQVGNQAYTSDEISAQWNQVLTSDGKLAANIRGSVVHSAYEDQGAFPGRRDIDYRAGAALIYNVQLWLKARLAYEFESFNSNQFFDYNDNRITLGVAIGY